MCDQGYRDTIPILNDLGLVHKMPPVLRRGERQLTTEEANESRLITKTRWIVEMRNGHIKSIFKFLNRNLEIPHSVNLGHFYRIAGAIINAYHEPIQMADATPVLAREMVEKCGEPNIMQARVEIDNLKRRRHQDWIRMNERHMPDFPLLPMEYLRHLTYGVYQLRLASSYIQDKLQREGEEILEFDQRNDEPNLVKTRICSRFRNATKYQQWIAFRQGANPIEAYYCTCKTGARTVGTCAHIASVLWYLGNARHNPEQKYPSLNVLEATEDTARRYDNVLHESGSESEEEEIL